MEIKILGIDLAKNVFQLHGVDAVGKVVLKKRLRREKLVSFIAQLSPCLILMEACAGAHYWSRKFEQMGHQTKLIHPQYVTPYVRTQKNDAHDATAIVEAGTRPSMVFVPKKTIEQQDIQCLHRVRSRLVKHRTGLVNQIRGLLSEYGIVIAQGIHQARKKIPCILEDADNELTMTTREIFSDLYEELVDLDKHILGYEKQLESIYKSNESCQLLSTIPGIGYLTGTAVLASVGDVNVFKNGRHLAAYLGLVPKQRSSGNKQQLLGITKRGDQYLRTLLIHGARSVVSKIEKKDTSHAKWIKSLKATKHKNVAYVALANKNARIIWSVLKKRKIFCEEKLINQAA